MTGVTARTHFNRAPLVRFLAAHADRAVAAPQDIAAPLAGWLDFRNAIALHGALSAEAPKRQRGTSNELARGAQTLREELRRVRELLTAPLLDEGDPAKNPALRSRHRWPVADETSAPDFLPLRRFILALERDMDAQITALRDLVRQQIAPLSPVLHRLAALDEALEQALAEPARDGLSGISNRLEKRFRDLPPEAIAAFANDVRATLRAELEFRFLPVDGLLEALDQEIAKA